MRGQRTEKRRKQNLKTWWEKGTKREITIKFIIVYKRGGRGGGTTISLNQGIVFMWSYATCLRDAVNGLF